LIASHPTRPPLSRCDSLFSWTSSRVFSRVAAFFLEVREGCKDPERPLFSTHLSMTSPAPQCPSFEATSDLLLSFPFTKRLGLLRQSNLQGHFRLQPHRPSLGLPPPRKTPFFLDWRFPLVIPSTASHKILSTFFSEYPFIRANTRSLSSFFLRLSFVLAHPCYFLLPFVVFSC